MKGNRAVRNIRSIYMLHEMSSFCLVVFLVILGGIVAPGNVDGQENNSCPVTTEFSGKNWWNYYDQGLKYMEAKCWLQAVQKFLLAIDQNPEDNRRARTVGIRFIKNYFPHRELGIAYYCLGRYADAIRTLENFKDQVPKEDKEVGMYLDKANEKLGLKECDPLKLTNEQWWGYFERGKEYSNDGCWQEAAIDFAEAITHRWKDESRVRTYGLHFSEYFPQREVGIAYYHLGHYLGAFYALKTSLMHEEKKNDRAEKFLKDVQQSLKKHPEKPCDGHGKIDSKLQKALKSHRASIKHYRGLYIVSKLSN